MKSEARDIRQRADLTFKHNKGLGRHGWLRLTPAYSVKVVRKILQENEDKKRVIDPFSGTGTTPLCATEMGKVGYATDINPFLVWFGNVKLTHYRSQEIDLFLSSAQDLVELISRNEIKPSSPPPIHNITRWWDKEALDYLCKLKAGIDVIRGNENAKNLLLVSFCRTCIGLSNAAFNHQSMSFKNSNKKSQLELISFTKSLRLRFEEDVNEVLEGAITNNGGEAVVVKSDARTLDQLKGKSGGRFDILVTSPPYPNRMSYIRELRPYMYWLGYLKEAKEAGELDWEAIGGTWGTATSRLASWKPDEATEIPDYLPPILDKIKSSHEKNGPLMSQYVWKYFQDMNEHFKSAFSVLRNGATAHYVVGNSTFYENVVPVERLYSDMLENAGFKNTNIDIVRKRNSKKALYEYIVSAEK